MVLSLNYRDCTTIITPSNVLYKLVVGDQSAHKQWRQVL
jgi:hypothetical protein